MRLGNPSGSAMIQVDSLSKYYGGKRALGPVSFEIQDGETVGFLGLNGAGKTTALRILACDLRPSAGTVSINGVDAISNPHSVRQRVGFLPEFPPLYQDMIVTDYLHFAGRLRGMSSAAVKARMPRVIELTHIDDVAGEPISHLSHGYRQRVGVAQAIIHEPALLILDEPTRGLDPVQIVEMRNMIVDLKESHTVLISSHILTEISQTCDRLLVLDHGEILAAGSEDELTASSTTVKRVIVMVRPGGDGGDGVEAVESCLRAVDGVRDIDSAPAGAEGGGESVRVYTLDCERDVRAEVSRAICSAGHDLLKLDYSSSELERTFIKLVQGDSDAHN